MVTSYTFWASKQSVNGVAAGLPVQSAHRLHLSFPSNRLPTAYSCLHARGRAPLQSLLAEWRSELSRQPLALSEADACAVLGLRPAAGEAIGEEELRRAYRNLARWGKVIMSSPVPYSWSGSWGVASAA